MRGGGPGWGDGGDEGTRTPDPRDANAVLFQLSYIPTAAGAARHRTGAECSTEAGCGRLAGAPWEAAGRPPEAPGRAGPERRCGADARSNRSRWPLTDQNICSIIGGPMTTPPQDLTAALATLQARWGAAAPRRAGWRDAGRGTASNEDAGAVVGALATVPLRAPDPSETPAARLAPGRVVSTGFAALDAILGPGGLPRSASVALRGEASSGTTTLALRLVAEAQAAGLIAAWLDLSRSFDPGGGRRSRRGAGVAGGRHAGEHGRGAVDRRLAAVGPVGGSPRGGPADLRRAGCPTRGAVVHGAHARNLEAEPGGSPARLRGAARPAGGARPAGRRRSSSSSSRPAYRPAWRAPWRRPPVSAWSWRGGRGSTSAGMSSGSRRR